VLARVERFERMERMERRGLRAELDTLNKGYPPQLRGDARAFAAFRARWLSRDPAPPSTACSLPWI
jgi:hypothetical protein